MNKKIILVMALCISTAAVSSDGESKKTNDRPEWACGMTRDACFASSAAACCSGCCLVHGNSCCGLCCCVTATCCGVLEENRYVSFKEATQRVGLTAGTTFLSCLTSLVVFGGSSE